MSSPVYFDDSNTNNSANHAAKSSTIEPPKSASPEYIDHYNASRVANPNQQHVILPNTPSEWQTFTHTVNRDVKKKIKNMRRKLPVTVETLDIAGVTVRRVTPLSPDPDFAQAIYIDVHGGAFVFFSGQAGLEEALLIASRVGITVFSVDYRMPPTHPYPAGLQDVMSVFTQLSKQFNEYRIVLGGTSAGAGLAIATIQSLIENNAAVPCGLYAGTPWADLSTVGDSRYTNHILDRVLLSYDGILTASASLYANGIDLQDSRISPVYGSFEGFPSTYLVSGTRDLFLSDTVRINRRLRNAGVNTTLDVYEGLSHADYILASATPESQQVYQELAVFLKCIVTAKDR